MFKNRLKIFFRILQTYKFYLPAELPIVDACWLVTSAWLWTDSFESDDNVPRVEPSLFKLLALLTIVATVRQYRALASESLVMLDCINKHPSQHGSASTGRRYGTDCTEWVNSTIFASQTDFTSWPRALCVLEVRPLSNAGGGTPRRAATEASSFSPMTPTSIPGRSVKPTLPRINTAANTRTTSKKGIPKTPVKNISRYLKSVRENSSWK